ncbi:hypothetical protein MICRO116_770003 [Micrococcus sp. 116]|nr:hypothetical protein MICRO116_770003 [Micrococcus sp. 116]
MPQPREGAGSSRRRGDAGAPRTAGCRTTRWRTRTRTERRQTGGVSQTFPRLRVPQNSTNIWLTPPERLAQRPKSLAKNLAAPARPARAASRSASG